MIATIVWILDKMDIEYWFLNIENFKLNIQYSIDITRLVGCQPLLDKPNHLSYTQLFSARNRQRAKLLFSSIMVLA